jgi:Chaperone of endosialidase/TGF-beta propeptide
MHFTMKSIGQVVFQRLLTVLALVAARVLIWARERQIMAERARKTILLLAATLLSAGTLASAQITPSADAYTNSADPTTNFGAATLLDVDGASQLSYIQFNLASIPSGASVSQATLKLYVNAVTTPGTFNVDYVNGSWQESTLTFDLSPALGNTIESNIAVTAPSKNQYLLINVTSAVQAWLDGSQPNDGIALVANSTFNVSFDSKENAGTSHPAELDIVFAGAGTITGVTTATGSGLTGGGTSGNLSLSLTNGCAATQVLQWSGTAWVCSSAGTGTITGVTAGNGLTGGGATGKVTLRVNPSVVPLLADANTFTQPQTIASNLGVTGNLYLPLATYNGTAGVMWSGPTPMLHNYGVTSSYNAFAGGAGNFTTAGLYLTGVGYGSLQNDGRGTANTAVGYNSLMGDSTGGLNTAVGASSGQSVDQSAITGVGDTFLGTDTELSTGSLWNATAIGAHAVAGESNAVVLGCVNGVNNCTTSPIVGIGSTTPGCSFADGNPAYCQMDLTGGNLIVRGPSPFNTSNQTAYMYLGDTAHYIAAVDGVGLQFGTFDAPYVQIDDETGNVHATDYFYWSSRRWKTNIQTLHGALDTIEHLRGVTYDETRGGKRHELGFIAEEVGKVVPELVTYEKNGKDASGVDYARVSALLVEATKEQQKLIRAQLRQIKTLQAEVKTQRSQIKAQDVSAKIQQAQLNDLAAQVKVVQTALKVSGQMNSSVLASNLQPAK